jgi:hypothetical protein
LRTINTTQNIVVVSCPGARFVPTKNVNKRALATDDKILTKAHAQQLTKCINKHFILQGQQELMKSANLLFGNLDTSYIWEFCGHKFEKASCQRFRINDTEANAVNYVGSLETTVVEMCALVDFLLDVVSIETYVETASEHLPNLFKSVINVLALKAGDLTAFEIKQALELAKKLLSKVQPAWNAWDVEDNPVSSTRSGLTQMEIGREATESISPPGSEDMDEVGVDLVRSFEKVPRAHELLMKDCVEAYQDFFVTFLATKAFTKNFDPHECLAKVVKRPHDTLEERSRYLERLLQGKFDYFFREIEEMSFVVLLWYIRFIKLNYNNIII